MKNATLKTQQFNVHIPNLEGDGIAEIVPVDVQTYFDPDLGEDVLTPESLELIDRVKARRMGLMLPNEIKELREKLELTQAEMSGLLQIGAKSYTRWETGRARPSRSINLLLCALRDGQIDVHYLRALRHPASRAADWAPRQWHEFPIATLLRKSWDSALASHPPTQASQEWLDRLAVAFQTPTALSATPKEPLDPRRHFGGSDVWVGAVQHQVFTAAAPQWSAQVRPRSTIGIAFDPLDPHDDLSPNG
jgi:DNA-binding transcriptional regulator YiaG